MKKQKVVLYRNQDRRLFYVGIYNADTVEKSASINANYSRARWLLKEMNDGGEARGLKSGFMMALINTNFEGWDEYINTPEYTPAEAVEQKKLLIEMNAGVENPLTYVGSDKIFIKGEKKAFGMDASWTRKWNVRNMTQQKIYDKVTFILKSINEEVPSSIYRDAYMVVVTEGGVQARHNWGDYQVNDLVSLFRYVRNYIGKDI